MKNIDLEFQQGNKYYLVLEKKNENGEIEIIKHPISLPRHGGRIVGIETIKKVKSDWSKRLANYKKAKSMLKAECIRKDYYKIFTNDTQDNNVYTRTSDQIKEFASKNNMKHDDYNKFVDFINSNVKYVRNARQTSFTLRDPKEIIEEKKAAQKDGDKKKIITVKMSERKQFIPIESGSENKIIGFDENGNIMFC